MGHERSRVTRLTPHHYVFSSTWLLPAQPAEVFAVLAALEQYPAWWPEFKKAKLDSPDHGTFALRSALPITLHFELCREIEDAEALHLRARATGDIDGTVEWQLSETAAGTRADFAQEVDLRHPLATKIDLAIRPLLEWNHRRAMTSGAESLERRFSSR
jgi:uncharacterized protein YndB with AHSA1/START domain